MSAEAVQLLFLLAFAGVGVLTWRTHTRWWRERDERAGRLGGFGRIGRERGRPGRPVLVALDVLLGALTLGAVGALALWAALR